MLLYVGQNELFQFYRVVVERLAFLLVGECSELMGLGIPLIDTHAAAHLPLVGISEHLPDVFPVLGAGAVLLEKPFLENRP